MRLEDKLACNLVFISGTFVIIEILYILYVFTVNTSDKHCYNARHAFMGYFNLEAGSFRKEILLSYN